MDSLEAHIIWGEFLEKPFIFSFANIIAFFVIKSSNFSILVFSSVSWVNFSKDWKRVIQYLIISDVMLRIDEFSLENDFDLSPALIECPLPFGGLRCKCGGPILTDAFWNSFPNVMPNMFDIRSIVRILRWIEKYKFSRSIIFSQNRKFAYHWFQSDRQALARPQVDCSWCDSASETSHQI